jgi:hypothetical protein
MMEVAKIRHPITNEPIGDQPEWHKDIEPRFKLSYCGHWFRFYGIDPAKPDVIFFKYLGPTKQTEKRKKNAID